MKLKTNFCLILLISLACGKKAVIDKTDPPSPDADPGNPALIYLGTHGKLIYNKFANEGETNKDNVVPDFSMAGYKGGGIALPDAPVRKTISAIQGDNTKLIQNAIDEIGNLQPDGNGIRGALLLKAGTYNCSDSLIINKSGVVIRGEGQGSNGTILKTNKIGVNHSFVQVKGSGSGLGEITGSRKKIISSYVPTGAMSFEVESASAFAVGDNIAIIRTPNQAWIDLLDMAQYGWTASSYAISFERTITAQNGNSLSLNAPVVDPMQSKYGGGSVYKTSISGRISNCGVENLRIVSSYVNDNDELHGWDAVLLERVENCWVKQVTAQYFGYSCVTIGNQSSFNTVEECAMLDPKSQTTGGRKYSFNMEGAASFNLFQRCFTRGGRHDFVTGSRVPGPNVFLDCYAVATTADIGPHHRWSTGLLFDNVYGGQIRVQNRGASGSGHGWSGAQTMFWNCLSSSNDFEVESPKGSKNWGIGCIGRVKTGPGYWEGWGVPVTPRSLYLSQLKDRLGTAALSRIATSAQLGGTIRDQLKNWAGEGKL